MDEDKQVKMEPNTRLVSIGTVRTARIICPCCYSVYEVELRADSSKGSSLVIMETNEDGDYKPAIYMHCDICGMHFKVRT